MYYQQSPREVKHALPAHAALRVVHFAGAAVTLRTLDAGEVRGPVGLEMCTPRLHPLVFAHFLIAPFTIKHLGRSISLPHAHGFAHTAPQSYHVTHITPPPFRAHGRAYREVVVEKLHLSWPWVTPNHRLALVATCVHKVGARFGVAAMVPLYCDVRGCRAFHCVPSISTCVERATMMVYTPSDSTQGGHTRVRFAVVGTVSIRSQGCRPFVGSCQERWWP